MRRRQRAGDARGSGGVTPERAGRGDGEQGSVQKQHNFAIRQELSAHSLLFHCRRRLHHKLCTFLWMSVWVC